MAASSSIIVLKQLTGNEPTHLYPLQEALLPYLHLINTGWFVIWCATALILIARLIREYRAHRRGL